jgi:hypothetical protein
MGVLANCWVKDDYRLGVDKACKLGRGPTRAFDKLAALLPRRTSDAVESMCVTIALSDAADSNWYTLAALGRTTLCMESTGQSETKRKRCAKCLNHEWETHKTRHYENQNFPNVAVPDVSRITATRVDGGEVNMAWPAGEVDKVLFIQYNTDLVDAREAEDRKSYGHNVADSSVPCIAVLSTSVSVRPDGPCSTSGGSCPRNMCLALPGSSERKAMHSSPSRGSTTFTGPSVR